MINLLSLLDDIAATMDDVAVMTKVALKKTSALMSDDLAVNAGVVHGVKASRELPIVFKIFAGSLVNKVICILLVIVFSIYLPIVLDALLMIGGLYLSYEGVEKVLGKINKSKKIEKNVVSEKQKIWGAIKTDFILSVEIILIANSVVEGAIMTRLISLAVIGTLASVIIYGLVGIIVKIDDFGLWLIDKGFKKPGVFLVNSMPVIMKSLGIIGTVAMILVGGGIFNHFLHLSFLPELLINFLLGVIGGFVVFGVVKLVRP